MPTAFENKPLVIVVGLACLDHRFHLERFPPERRRQPVRSYHEALGGPAAVAAQAVVRLGGRASMWGRRGADASGGKLEELLSNEGIDTSGYRAFPSGKSPVCGVFVASGGERFLFPYWGERLPRSPNWLPIERLESARAVLVDSRWPEGALYAAQAARKLHVPVVVDLDRDLPKAWRLAEHATHVIADEDLAGDLGGVEAVLRRLKKMGTWGAVTLGAKGVEHAGGHVPAFQVSVMDSTGAGDVFHGAFTLALAEGATEADALQFASAAGALRCRLAEPPRRDQVDSLLRQQFGHAGARG